MLSESAMMTGLPYGVLHEFQGPRAPFARRRGVLLSVSKPKGITPWLDVAE